MAFEFPFKLDELRGHDAVDLLVEVCDGKYAYVSLKKGGSQAYRYGERWRDTLGDGFILALASELDELRKKFAGAGSGEALMPTSFAEMIVTAEKLPRGLDGSTPLPLAVDKVKALIAKAITLDRYRTLNPDPIAEAVVASAYEHEDDPASPTARNGSELRAHVKRLVVAGIQSAQARGARAATASISEDDYAEASRAGHEAFMACLKDKGLVR